MRLDKHLWLCAALPLNLVLSGDGASAQNNAAAPASPAPTSPAPAATTPAATDAAPQDFPQGILFPYYMLDRVMDGKVDKDGHVDYVAMQNDKQGQQFLALFMQAIATADTSKFPVLPNKVVTKDKLNRDVETIVEDHSAELVFWINAYNAHVLSAILAAYPISSPDNIPDFDTAKTRRVGGQNYSLEELRKKIITMDPRAFFALTDGTLGGPLLRNRAYRLTDLNPALDEAISYYVSNPNQVQLLQLEKKVTVNPILQQIDPYFAPKSARHKWEGIRKLLADYSIVGSSKRFFTNNPDVNIQFGRPNRALNRDPGAGPVSTGQ